MLVVLVVVVVGIVFATACAQHATSDQMQPGAKRLVPLSSFVHRAPFLPFLVGLILKKATIPQISTVLRRRCLSKGDPNKEGQEKRQDKKRKRERGTCRFVSAFEGGDLDTVLFSSLLLCVPDPMVQGGGISLVPPSYGKVRHKRALKAAAPMCPTRSFVLQRDPSNSVAETTPTCTCSHAEREKKKTLRACSGQARIENRQRARTHARTNARPRPLAALRCHSGGHSSKDDDS